MWKIDPNLGDSTYKYIKHGSWTGVWQFATWISVFEFLDRNANLLRQLIFGHSNRPELDINENVNQIKHGAFAKTYKILRDIGILVEKVCKYINCNRSTPRCSIATVQVSRKYSFGKKERKRWKFQDKSEVIQPVFPPWKCTVYWPNLYWSYSWVPHKHEKVESMKIPRVLPEPNIVYCWIDFFSSSASLVLRGVEKVGRRGDEEGGLKIINFHCIDWNAVKANLAI